MTVANVANKVREDGNGVKTDFDFSFKVYETDQLLVYKVVKATGVPTLQTLDDDYTVTLNSDSAGGTVSYDVAPTALEESFIISSFAIVQETDIPDRGALRESQIENSLDLLTLLIRQLQEIIDRCVKFAVTSTSSDIEMPEPEAGKIPGWNDDADGMENYDNPAVAMAAAEAAQAAAELAQTGAELAETNAETAQAAAEAAAALVGALTEELSVVANHVSTDASAAAVFLVDADDDFTLDNPTNATDGQRIIWRIKQDATGSRIITLDSKFTVNSEISSVVLSTAASAIDHIGAIYNEADDKFEIVAFSSEQA